MNNMNPKPYTVACYYFPNYHIDARNEAAHGKGWSEWELVKAAKPRFPGHQQPKVPAWGYTDEANPVDMAQKIDAAADNGVNSFIFDWYWYNDGPYLQRGLDEGFLGAANNSRMKFACMWANHDWTNIHPMTLGVKPVLQYPGAVTAETIERMTDHIIEKYFLHPSHWMIQGKPYFSVYDLNRLILGLGGLAPTAAVLRRFREKTIAAGLPGLHLNAVVYSVKILPGEVAIKNPAELLSYLGFDSITSYVWVHHVKLDQFPQTPYDGVMAKAIENWHKNKAAFPLPYHPNVTMGWDSSPRCHQDCEFANKGYPYTPTLSGNTPAAFKRGLQAAKDFLATQPADERILTINAWNEWTEGSYLEPDMINGMGYLQAIRDVFGPNGH